MIRKEILAQLPMGYCITLAQFGGRRYCITASEARDGKVLLIDVESGRVQEITGLAGGIMSILPVPEEPAAFLAIQRFYPVFDSREAEVVCCRLESLEGDVLPATVETVVRLPYVHRIALAGKQGERKLVAATLCRWKDFVEDWSRDGQVWEYTLDNGLHAVDQRLLLEGIHKNHGMFTWEAGHRILIAGEEGVWALRQDGIAEKFCDEAVGDLCMYDVDGDGVEEMVCITPFHGNTLKVLKPAAGGWQCLDTAPLKFGHAVWCGPCGGSPVVLSCSRGGDRCTRLYRPGTAMDSSFALVAMDVDKDVGAANIAVEPRENGIVLYAANHGCGETARYEIT